MNSTKSNMEQRWRRGAVANVLAMAMLGAMCVAVQPANAQTADFTTWAIGSSAISGFDPHETKDDVTGLNGHADIGKPAMVTAMENTCGGFCGMLFWNPDTNAFRTYCVTGGFDFAIDINRGAPASPRGAGNFGGATAGRLSTSTQGSAPT